MSLPSFYIPSYTAGQQEVLLDEDNSRHVIQVLRMNPGELLQLTDGRGNLLEGEIVDAHKKRCRVAVRSVLTSPPSQLNVTIAISPVKNASRFEWFLEKATEIGVSRIVPLLCERTERQSIRTHRLRTILISAMLQSQQTWLPILPEPTTFSQLIGQSADTSPVATGGAEAAAGIAELRLIAHCLEAPRPTTSLADLVREQAAPASGTLILIGPEGDFTPKEVKMALTAGYLPVGLGANRLRTETAGVVAATLLCIK
jgi:16S rRNA (uracil1498-N3)-methyltransferase